MATRVLLIDDNPQDRLLTRRALAAEFPDLELSEAISQEQLDAALREPAFDIVVTDFQLRWTDGLKVLEAIHAVVPDMPVVMFTNTGTEEIAASAFRLHVADYIVKAPGHYGRLAHGARVALKNADERRALQATIRRHAERAAFMNRASTALAASLDYETTLASVANLAVSAIADWCAVDIVADGKTQRLAVAHLNPEKVELARTLQRYEDPTSPYSVPHVIQTRTPVLVPLITDEMIVAAARGDAEQVRAVRALGLVSYMCVPLVAHSKTLGALTLATSESQRHFDDDDLTLAQELAHRAALAVDNAQTYQQVQVADRLKDEFLATLSHELRTPLNAILGYARLLQGGAITGEKMAGALNIVERNASALTHMVEDVLEVSRIISGKMRLSIQAVDLPTVVQSAVESVAPAAEAKRLRVHTSIDPNGGPISGDPDRLQQIVWNLVSNAVKFTPKGGRIQVRVERVESQVHIVVSDTGVGIKPEFLPHLFERFRQADSTMTRHFGGLGLGLAITRHLVELHGGSVEAISDGEGNGATFRVRLPLMIVHAQPAVDERRKLTRASSGSMSVAKLVGIHVLAVDDDPDALSLLTEILELSGARVTTVDSGAHVLELLGTLRPDVLVADIGLPVMDGLDMIRRLRESPDSSARNTPAIALTAYARSQDRVRALESGFQTHMAKPADPAELVAAIGALVKHARTSQ
jgi:signal transduction histidine kinase/DNA-binding response OmpR family regulator